MFASNQLNLLLALQTDDWNPAYFRNLVREAGDCSLADWINRLSNAQVDDLQLALDILLSLPSPNPNE